MVKIKRDTMFYRFSLYGFLKNLRFFEPFLLLIFRSYGLTFFQIGVLYAIRDIATNLLEIPTGIVSDTFGRKRSLVGAFLAYLVSFGLFYLLDDFLYLGLAMVLFGLGEAFRTGTHKALILEHLKINRITELKVAYYGLTRSASQLGSALNALIAAGLVFYTGSYRMMFLAALVPSLLDLINVASYPDELDGEIGQAQGREVPGRIRAVLDDFFKIFRNPKGLRVLLNSSGFTAFFEAAKDYLQPILAGLALSLAVFGDLQAARREAVIIGLVYFGIYLLTSLASRGAYDISQRFRGLDRAVNLTFLAGVGLFLMAGGAAALQFQVLAVICFLLLYALNNLRRPINIGLISDQIPTRILASGLSAESQITTLLSALIAPLLGFLADSLGIGVGIGLIGLLMLVLYFFVRVK